MIDEKKSGREDPHRLSLLDATLDASYPTYGPDKTRQASHQA